MRRNRMISTGRSTKMGEFPATEAPFSLPVPLPVLVRCASDMEILRKIRNRQRLCFLLRIPGLPVETSKKWESKLNSCLKECGCSLGAKFVIAAFGASVIWQSIYSFWSFSHWPVFFVRTFLAVIVAGAIGKFVGIARAKAEIRTIEEKIRDFEQRHTAGG